MARIAAFAPSHATGAQTPRRFHARSGAARPLRAQRRWHVNCDAERAPAKCSHRAPRRKFALHRIVLHASLAVALSLVATRPAAADRSLTNVSYDVTREFYDAYNQQFREAWKVRTGEQIEIHQSHGGSSKQARAVIDGLDADVVTMNQALDIDAIAKSGRIAKDWESRLPNASAPFSSTIVFVVRKGNPKGIRDWDDLAKPGIGVVLPNPKTSGNGRYSYLAAWAWATKKSGEDAAPAFLKAIFANVPVLDTGGRAATTTFAERGIGDVLLTFENEVALIQQEFGADRFEAVTPSLSILAPLPVAWVDAVVEARGTSELARAYLEGLYAPAAQVLGAQLAYRPSAPAIAAQFADRFPKLELVTVESVAGSWQEALAKHFQDGGSFDRIYAVK
jgi:sulfate transport system substrate-binding protein